MMKIFMIVCDGLGDRPFKDGKTPLEKAEKPYMDYIAENGICGIMDTVAQGVRPGSDTSHLALFGYNPYEVYTGRGPFEALGVGLNLKKGDVAFRCNFATIKDDGRIIDRRAGRQEYGLEKLAKSLDGVKINDVKIKFKKCVGHRAVLIFQGRDLSPKVSDVDHEGESSKKTKYRISAALDKTKEARRTSEILNEFTEFSRKVLSKHPVNKERISKGMLPANIILSRGAGVLPHIIPFKKKYKMRAVGISAVSLITGVCRAVGMDTIKVKGATGHFDSNIHAKAEAAIKALRSYDFVFLHIKGADELSHDGNFYGKVKMIERIDREVIKPIIEKVKNTTIVLTADHSTPCSIRQHSADPVPVAILGDVRSDDIKKFTERDCAKGGLNRICGRNLMGILLDLSNRAKLFGA
ncbi:MAG: 2,3-bisphosphoglycerate-independent phosphoglycerate mutase [Candidatus Altiarchaeota archaeon]